jgi:transcription elongation factor GreB
MSKAFVKDDDEPFDDEPEPAGAVEPGCITEQGYRRLQTELEQLWKVERPRVTSEVAWAAAQGDRSENAEYIYGKRRLREIDRRVRFLQKRLEKLVIVRPSPEQAGAVFFGAWVTLEDEDGKTTTYRLVGSDEIDLKRGWISLDSPVGKALLGKRVGDTVVVRRPKGEIELQVAAIRYEDG